MRSHFVKHASLTAAALLLTACAGFFDKDNTPEPTPLTDYTAELKPTQRWSTYTGHGAGDEYLKMSPAVGTNAIITTSTKGFVTAVDKNTGHIIWQTDTKLSILAGPAAGNGIVVVSSKDGDVWALSEATGQLLWKKDVTAEILAKPAVGDNIVIVKTVNGQVYAYSAQSGKERWSYQQAEPSLILRAASAPVIQNNNVLIGFASGNLSKFTLQDGRQLWMRPIAEAQGAFAIQRMIDVDADPVVYNHHLYAATYQGQISSLDAATGETLWAHDISSYTGMTADDESVYISDAKGYVWDFNANSGLVNWRQTKLEARTISGPANTNNYIIVGDAEGYLHWLSKKDGHFSARVRAGSAIYAAPIVQNNVLYAQTNKGYLVAYTLN